MLCYLRSKWTPAEHTMKCRGERNDHALSLRRIESHLAGTFKLFVFVFDFCIFSIFLCQPQQLLQLWVRRTAPLLASLNWQRRCRRYFHDMRTTDNTKKCCSLRSYGVYRYSEEVINYYWTPHCTSLTYRQVYATEKADVWAGLH